MVYILHSGTTGFSDNPHVSARSANPNQNKYDDWLCVSIPQFLTSHIYQSLVFCESTAIENGGRLMSATEAHSLRGVTRIYLWSYFDSPEYSMVIHREFTSRYSNHLSWQWTHSWSCLVQVSLLRPQAIGKASKLATTGNTTRALCKVTVVVSIREDDAIAIDIAIH